MTFKMNVCKNMEKGMAMDIQNLLQPYIDPDYREFHSRLLPGVPDILGVRVPQLRQVAGQILKEDWRTFLEEAQGATYEERQLQGLVTAGAWKKMDLKELLERTAAFIPWIDNWCVCDIFCGAYKAADSRYREEIWDFIRAYFVRQEEYAVRFAVVMTLGHYCDTDHAEEAFTWFDRVEKGKYYVDMAVAWAISVYFVKMRERTMQYLRCNQLDDWTYHKALQKIIESNRVDKDTKEMIRKMKKR